MPPPLVNWGRGSLLVLWMVPERMPEACGCLTKGLLLEWHCLTKTPAPNAAIWASSHASGHEADLGPSTRKTEHRPTKGRQKEGIPSRMGQGHGGLSGVSEAAAISPQLEGRQKPMQHQPGLFVVSFADVAGGVL